MKKKNKSNKERFVEFYNQVIEFYFEIKRNYWRVTSESKKKALNRSLEYTRIISNLFHKYMIREKPYATKGKKTPHHDDVFSLFAP
jgi:hypothetical protein